MYVQYASAERKKSLFLCSLRLELNLMNSYSRGDAYFKRNIEPKNAVPLENDEARILSIVFNFGLFRGDTNKSNTFLADSSTYVSQHRTHTHAHQNKYDHGSVCVCGVLSIQNRKFQMFVSTQLRCELESSLSNMGMTVHKVGIIFRFI